MKKSKNFIERFVARFQKAQKDVKLMEAEHWRIMSKQTIDKDRAKIYREYVKNVNAEIFGRH